MPKDGFMVLIVTDHLDRSGSAMRKGLGSVHLRIGNEHWRIGWRLTSSKTPGDPL